MSLICNECGRDMGPGNTLPGREGVLVSPNLIVMVWSINESNNIDWRFVHHLSTADRSLCFRCIEHHLPPNRRNNLDAFYAAYEAETNYNEIEESYRGKMIGGDEFDKKVEAGKKSIALRNAPDNSQCLYCDKNVTSDREPYFTGIALDRVYCRQHTSGFIMMDECNYSFTNMRSGLTFVRICFQCFQTNFPKTFKQLSHDILGTTNPDFSPKCELFIAPGIIKAMEEEYGVEEAHRQIQNFFDGTITDDN